MGWYNKIRFGDWLEFGFKYQLTGMNTHILTFSPANLLINLHNYFLKSVSFIVDLSLCETKIGRIFHFLPHQQPCQLLCGTYQRNYLHFSVCHLRDYSHWLLHLGWVEISTKPT